MNKQLSIYLDGLRFLASVAVFFAHIPGFMGGYLWQLGGGGHLAVVFFFVLSGFVISFVTTSKEKNATTYAVNRLARIYSVAGPAIFLTVAAYGFISVADPESYHKLKATLYDPLTTTLAAVFFLNQSWREIIFFTNGPYWSLGYEVVYYAFCGVFLFTVGRRRVIYLLVLVAAMGPSIALYLPVWFLGYLSYRVTVRTKLSLSSALPLFVFSFLLFLIMPLSGLLAKANASSMALMNSWWPGLINSNATSFVGDYMMAALVSINFIAFSSLGEERSVFGAQIGSLIKKLSAHTFSIYLYHMPLLYVMAALYPHKGHVLMNAISCLVATPLLIFALSTQTENKKQVFRRYFERLLA